MNERIMYLNLRHSVRQAVDGCRIHLEIPSHYVRPRTVCPGDLKEPGQGGTTKVSIPYERFIDAGARSPDDAAVFWVIRPGGQPYG